VTNPVKVVRASGTVLSANVTIGYDVPRRKVEALLLEAAQRAGLEEPFVQVVELGNFSVEYRAAGMLTEVRRIVSSRSVLRMHMLDALHEGGVEIVSPTFMYLRTQARDSEVRPDATGERRPRSRARSRRRRLTAARRAVILPGAPRRTPCPPPSRPSTRRAACCAAPAPPTSRRRS
jgi:hypothetical protein